VALSDSRKFDYLIVDGDELVKVSSYSQNAESVLDELHYDTANATVSVFDMDGYKEILIKRTYNVTVACDGKTEQIEVGSMTVGELLDDLNITLGDNDILSCKLSDTVFDGMEIIVSRVEIQYKTEQKTIPSSAKYIDSPYMNSGTELTVIEGSNGVADTVYKYVYTDGEITSRSVVSRTVVTESTDSIVAKGSRGADADDNEPVVDTSESDDGVVTTLNGETLNYTKVISMTATAYTYNSGANITSSGAPAQVGIVAALPSTLPQGTHVYIVAADGSWEYGVAIVGDRPGRNILDLFMESYSECINFGVRDALVYVLD
jgi:uncharacterized protein YabE (DUF348 family)